MDNLDENSRNFNRDQYPRRNSTNPYGLEEYLLSYGVDPVHDGVEEFFAVGEDYARRGEGRADFYYGAIDNYQPRDIYGQGRPGSNWRGESRPNYSGLGPQNYQRSDERIKVEICEELTRDTLIDPSEVAVEVAKGEVSLSGSVVDKAMKWAIEDVVDRVSGVQTITNRIKVKS
jgi:hypothetical protein